MPWSMLAQDPKELNGQAYSLFDLVGIRTCLAEKVLTILILNEKHIRTYRAKQHFDNDNDDFCMCWWWSKTKKLPEWLSGGKIYARCWDFDILSPLIYYILLLE